MPTSLVYVMGMWIGKVTLANKSSHVHINTLLSQPPDHTWCHPSGRPWYKWFHSTNFKMHLTFPLETSVMDTVVQRHDNLSHHQLCDCDDHDTMMIDDTGSVVLSINMRFKLSPIHLTLTLHHLSLASLSFCYKNQCFSLTANCMRSNFAVHCCLQVLWALLPSWQKQLLWELHQASYILFSLNV